MATEPTPPPARRDEDAVPSAVVDDVHLSYRVYEDVKPTLRQIVARRFRPRAHRTIDAVRGVSITAYPGDAIAIVGRNGSGKSTLMRCLAGLLQPTRGAVYARSTPVLLGVGAVLNQELSGRRNIYLGGTALGLTRAELDDRAEEIIAFAGLGEFIDMPMRAYSSGMKSRLQFAIATSVTPDVLLIDEALAVGDAEFRQRSTERIHELVADAGTLFLVSHSGGMVKELCNRAVWLDAGQVRMAGDVAEVLEAYESEARAEPPEVAALRKREEARLRAERAKRLQRRAEERERRARDLHERARDRELRIRDRERATKELQRRAEERDEEARTRLAELRRREEEARDRLARLRQREEESRARLEAAREAERRAREEERRAARLQRRARALLERAESATGADGDADPAGEQPDGEGDPAADPPEGQAGSLDDEAGSLKGSGRSEGDRAS